MTEISYFLHKLLAEINLRQRELNYTQFPALRQRPRREPQEKNPAEVVFFTPKITNPFICFFLVSDNGRTLEFPGPFSFISKRLVNHTIGTKIVADFENCKLHCYYEHNCVSVNYHVSTKTCELNNATHRWHNNEFKDENGYLYHGADVSSFQLTALLPLLPFPFPPPPPPPPPPDHQHYHLYHHHYHCQHHFSFNFPLLLLKVKSKISTDYITSPQSSSYSFAAIYYFLCFSFKNACEEFNCLNGGTCQSGFTVERYRCLCPPGFRGKRCQKGKNSILSHIV